MSAFDIQKMMVTVNVARAGVTVELIAFVCDRAVCRNNYVFVYEWMMIFFVFYMAFGGNDARDFGVVGTYVFRSGRHFPHAVEVRLGCSVETAADYKIFVFVN